MIRDGGIARACHFILPLQLEAENAQSLPQYLTQIPAFCFPLSSYSHLLKQHDAELTVTQFNTRFYVTLRLAKSTISHTLIIYQNYATPETFNSNSHSLRTSFTCLVSQDCVSHNTFTLACRRSLTPDCPILPKAAMLPNAAILPNARMLHSTQTEAFLLCSRACHLYTP